MKDEFKDIDFRSEELEREYIGVTFDHCDFTTARGYIINPNDNRLSHAKFFAVQSGRAERSRYGVEGLLAAYKIEIV